MKRLSIAILLLFCMVTAASAARYTFSGFVHQGAYSDATTYAYGDLVTSSTTTYLCYKDTCPAATEVTNTAYYVPWTVKGDTGAKGDTGDNGTNGSNGTSSYTYVAYASDASGTDFTTTFNADLNYVAIKVSATAIETPAASDFTGLWKNYRGATGATGAAGADGNGITAGSDGTYGWYTGNNTSVH